MSLLSPPHNWGAGEEMPQGAPSQVWWRWGDAWLSRCSDGMTLPCLSAPRAPQRAWALVPTLVTCWKWHGHLPRAPGSSPDHTRGPAPWLQTSPWRFPREAGGMLLRAVPVLVALPHHPALRNKALELETLPQGLLLGKPKLRHGVEGLPLVRVYILCVR